MPLILGTNSIKDTGYDVANSLRFNSGSSDYLNKTFGTPTSTKKGTHSFWFKLADDFTSVQFSGVWNNYYAYDISIDSSNRLNIYSTDTSTNTGISLDSTQVLRDPSAWYHVVVAIDTTQATASNRAKVYLNGLQITDFDTETYPNLNADLVICLGANNGSTSVGRSNYGGGANYYSGYMTEFIYVDGSQLDPTSFGEFDSDSPNIWKPKDVSGLTFGTNGFYLDFENASSLGADVSGNSNNFTVNNLTSIDQTTDTCTNNFCTLNPLVAATSRTDNQNYSEGNTIIIPNSTDNYGTTFSTIGVQGSGKWYWEAQIVWNGTSNNANFPRTIGFVTEDYAFNYSYLGQDQESWGMMFSDETPDQWFASHPDENNNEGGTMANGDTVNLALDLDNGYFYFGINGTYINSGNPTSGASGTGAVFTLTATDLSKFIIPAVTNATNTTYYKFNFGNPAYSISSGNSDANGLGNFENAVPSGYFSLCTKNLAEFG